MLVFAAAFERFQPIAGRNAELQQFRDGVKLGKFPQGRALDVRREGADFLQPKQAGSVVAGKGTNHALSKAYNNNGRRYEWQAGIAVIRICGGDKLLTIPITGMLGYLLFKLFGTPVG